MRILLLCHAFNSLSQRLYCELAGRGHQLSVEYDVADSVTDEAVALFRPDLIIAPYLRRAIPATIWRQHCWLVVHPGIVGDRGPSALDRAIQYGERACMGRDGVAGDRRDGRRSGLGVRGLPDARCQEVEHLSPRGH